MRVGGTARAVTKGCGPARPKPPADRPDLTVMNLTSLIGPIANNVDLSRQASVLVAKLAMEQAKAQGLAAVELITQVEPGGGSPGSSGAAGGSGGAGTASAGLDLLA